VNAAAGMLDGEPLTLPLYRIQQSTL